MMNRVQASCCGVILGRAAIALCRMLRRCNTGRCGVCTVLALCVGGSLAVAQVKPQGLESATIEKLPDVDGVVNAYTSVREWLDTLTTPKPSEIGSRLVIQKSTGVCVILRRSGRMMGVGVDTEGNEYMTRRAAGRAMMEVLNNPALQTLATENDKGEGLGAAIALDDLHAQVGRSLTFEFEVAGQLTPLLGKSLDQIGRKLEPGVDGLALRYGDKWAFLFPSQLRLSNSSIEPDRLLLNLSAQSGVPVKDLSDISTRHDLGLYSFRTINLAQLEAGRLPVQLFRGDLVVPQSDVTSESIVKMADALAGHIVESVWPDDGKSGPLGAMGGYEITMDRNHPYSASPLEQALLALALNRYAKLDQANAETKAAAVKAAKRIVADLAVVSDGEDDPRHDPVDCAAAVLAMSEHPGRGDDGEVEKFFVEMAERTVGSFSASSGYVNRLNPDGKARQISGHGQALIAAAMCRLLTRKDAGGLAVEAAVVRGALDAAWRSTQQPQHAALLPWIGWAEAEFAATTGQPLGHADELRLLLSTLNESRVAAGMQSGVPDLAGGFALRGEFQGPNARAQVTSQSLRPAAWFADALADTNLIKKGSAEQSAALGAQLQTMRFLKQLMVRENATWWVRNPVRALGGVRESSWNSDQPAAAQALGLITVVQTIKATQNPL